MIFSKTPLRVSLFGGGTDDPNYFQKYNARGAVTGFTINQFVWIFGSEIKVDQGFRFRLGYRYNEDVSDAAEIKHPIFREVLRDQPHLSRFHFSTMSALPSGAGLGSSSSFTVGLIALINYLNAQTVSQASLANEAIRYEREVLGESGGWQDQLHAAFGGINTFAFKNSAWTRTPLVMSEDNLRKLSDSLYIVYTGKLRSANIIEKSKKESINNHTLLSETYHLALEGEKALRQTSISLKQIGRLMIEGWNLKSRLSSEVTSTEIDAVYMKIMSEGAFGAKLSGAGGGGFFLVLAETAVAERIGDKLGREKIMKVSVHNSGVEIGDL